MPIHPNSRIHSVNDVDNELPNMRAYLLGAVRSWTMNRPDEVFALRNLVGGENWDWDGTPIYHLFLKHQEKGKSNEVAMADAAKDAGWILKAVLDGDNRHYAVSDAGMVNGYRLLPVAPNNG